MKFSRSHTQKKFFKEFFSKSLSVTLALVMVSSNILPFLPVTTTVSAQELFQADMGVESNTSVAEGVSGKVETVGNLDPTVSVATLNIREDKVEEKSEQKNDTENVMQNVSPENGMTTAAAVTSIENTVADSATVNSAATEENTEVTTQAENGAESSATSLVATTASAIQSLPNTVDNVVDRAGRQAGSMLSALGGTMLRSAAMARTLSREAATAPAPSTSGATDLSVDVTALLEAENNRYMNYVITVRNPDMNAHGASVKLTLPDGMRKISLSCRNPQGGAVCPEEIVYNDGTKEITRLLSNFPAGSTMELVLKARFPLNPPTSVNLSAEISVPAGMTDINRGNNIRSLNTAIVDGKADTLVKSFIQVTNPDLQPEVHVVDETKGLRAVVFNNPQPVTYTIRYENNGPWYADGAGIGFNLGLGNNIGNRQRQLEYENLNIGCIASEGAVCPEGFKIWSDQVRVKNGAMTTGYHSHSTYVEVFTKNNTKVPEMETGSYIDVTVTFTPKKISVIDTTGVCSDLAMEAYLRPEYAGIQNVSGIIDTVPANNEYTAETIAVISTNGELSQTSFPNMDIVCPKADLLVKSVSQNFEGVIETTPELSANGFGQNLVINNPRPLSYTVVYENKGPMTITDAGIKMMLTLPRGISIDYRDLKFDCTPSGGAVCPYTFHKSPNVAYESNGTFEQSSSNDTWNLMHQNNYQELVPSMPANSSITVTFTFTPTKIRDTYYEQCGVSNRNIRMNFYSVEIQDRNSFITDPVENNNRYSYNDMQSIRTSSIGFIDFGTIQQTNCPEPPKADLAVTSVSQSMVGNVEVEYATSENGFYTYPKVKNPQPVSFTATYSNLSGDDAAGATLIMKLGSPSSWTYGGIQYNNLQYHCSTTGGAECPVELVNFNNNQGIAKSGRISTSSHEMLGYKTPKFPEGSTITITATFTPEYSFIGYDRCGSYSYNHDLAFGEVRVSAPLSGGFKDINNENNEYNTFAPTSSRSFQRIANGEIGIVNIGTTRQISDACTNSRVSTVIETNAPKPLKNIVEDKEFEVVYIYKNEGTTNVQNVAISGRKEQQARYEMAGNIRYRDYSITCVATGDAVCPEKQGNNEINPYNGSIEAVEGIWQHQYRYPENHRLFNVTIPSLPAGSEVRMVVKYTLSDPHEVSGYDRDTRDILWERFFSSTTLPTNKFTSNSGNLSAEEWANALYVNDTQINNIFVARGSVECNNSDLLARQQGDGTIAPGRDMCLFVKIQNTGRAEASNMPFAATVPQGMTNIDVSKIQCVVTNAGSSAETACGENFYFDQEKRQIRGEIAHIADKGSVAIIIPGRTVDYTSTWQSVGMIPKQSGWLEREPATNTVYGNYKVQGKGASIEKSTSTRTATAGDEFTYVISARNDGTEAERIQNVKITDKIDKNFYYIKTNKITLQGGATISEAEKPSLVDIIDGQETILDADTPANHRPTRSVDGIYEWGEFMLPPNANVSIEFTVRVKPIYSCLETIHNSATMHYAKMNNVAMSVTYDGTLVGLDAEDVNLIGCKEMLANADIIEATQTIKNGKTAFDPESYNVLENDSVYNPLLSTVSHRDVSIRVVDRKNLDKRLLYMGSSSGISSQGADKMSGGFTTGNRLAGIAGVDPVDKNNGINVFDYKELPDLVVDTEGNATWRQGLTAGVYLGAYELCDKVNTLNCSIAPVVVKIPNPINNAPTAIDDTKKTLINTKIEIDVLLNDSDPDDDVLVIENISNPQNGTFTIENRKITFTPSFDFVGEARATYTVNDGHEGRASANILVLVERELNQPPVAVNDTARTAKNESITIDAKRNDSDPENQAITLHSLNVVNDSGTAEIRNEQVFFTPKQDFSGLAILQYTIRDAEGAESSAGVIIVEVFDNSAPIAEDDLDTALKNETRTIDVLSNDSDPNNNDLIITTISHQTNGTFTIIENGKKVQFVPDTDFVGEARAVYEIFDGVNGLARANIIVTVNESIAPIAVDDIVDGTYNQAIEIDVLKNDSDPRKGQLTLSDVIIEQTNGTFIKQGDKVLFTPNENFYGVATARYTISNQSNGSAQAKIFVTIPEPPVKWPNNQPPVAVTDDISVGKNTKIEINVLENDSDPDNDQLTITSIDKVRHGQFVLKDGKIEFTPDADFIGNASAVYTISDGKNGVDFAAIVVRVRETSFSWTETISRTGNFTKICGPNQTGSVVPFTHEITETATSDISLEDTISKAKDAANARMDRDFDRLGQDNANANGACTDDDFSSTQFFTAQKDFTKICASGQIASTVTVQRTVMVTTTAKTQAEAEAKALAQAKEQAEARLNAEGQAEANEKWACSDREFTSTKYFTAKKNFTRNTCEVNQIPGTILVERTVMITEKAPTQEEADAKALAKAKEQAEALVEAEGQDEANQNATCTDREFTSTKFFTAKKDFTKNNCEPGKIPGKVTVERTILATEKASTQEEADAKALAKAKEQAEALVEAEGQNEANEVGVCTDNEFSSTKTYTAQKEFERNNCGPRQTPGKLLVKRIVTVTEKATTQEEADAKALERAKTEAETELALHGQEEANNEASCINKDVITNTVSIPSSSSTTTTVTEEPLFSAPIVGGQCVSAVRNLDDPYLLVYYDDLGIMDRSNVNRAITRVEFVKLVLNAGKVDLNQNLDVSNLSRFVDIDQNSWYVPYVSYMVRTETMNGQEIIDENGNTVKIFRPNDTISRAEASKILSELVKKKDEALPEEKYIKTFVDVDPKNSLSAYVQYAYNSCLLHGRNTLDGQPIDGKPRIFEPEDSITLAETAKVLYNITHSNVDSGVNFTNTMVNVGKIITNITTTTTQSGTNTNQTTSTTTTLVPTITVGGQSFGIANLLQNNP